MRLQFKTFEEVIDYCKVRMGEEPYGKKNASEKAYTIVAQSPPCPLQMLKDQLLHEATLTMSVTRERIYRFIAERIVA